MPIVHNPNYVRPPVLISIPNVLVIYTDDEFVRFEGSQERIFLGVHGLCVGDKVKITFEKEAS